MASAVLSVIIMGTAMTLLVIATVLAIVVVLGRTALSAYLKYRDSGVVECPETHDTAGVVLDGSHAALSAVKGKTDLRLKACSRWPERQDCGQECLRQIAERPQDCLVRDIITRWYDGKNCAYCAKPVPPVHWVEHHPALVGPDGKTVPWPDVPAVDLPEVLESYRPVCWHCYVVTSVMREHPELVVRRDQ